LPNQSINPIGNPIIANSHTPLPGGLSFWWTDNQRSSCLVLATDRGNAQTAGILENHWRRSWCALAGHRWGYQRRRHALWYSSPKTYDIFEAQTEIRTDENKG